MLRDAHAAGAPDADGGARQVAILIGLLILLGAAYFAISRLTAGPAASPPEAPTDGAPKGFGISEASIREQIARGIAEGEAVERILFSDEGGRILVLVRGPSGNEREIILKRDEFGRYVDAEATHKVYP